MTTMRKACRKPRSSSASAKSAVRELQLARARRKTRTRLETRTDAGTSRTTRTRFSRETRVTFCRHVTGPLTNLALDDPPYDTETEPADPTSRSRHSSTLASTAVFPATTFSASSPARSPSARSTASLFLLRSALARKVRQISDELSFLILASPQGFPRISRDARAVHHRGAFMDGIRRHHRTSPRSHPHTLSLDSEHPEKLATRKPRLSVTKNVVDPPAMYCPSLSSIRKSHIAEF